MKSESKFQEAIELYKEGWQHNQNEIYLANIMFCMRKIGDEAKASDLAMAYFNLPIELDYLKREVAWLIYQNQFKDSIENDHFERIIDIGNRILILQPNFDAEVDILLNITKQYMNKNQNKFALDTISRIDINQLDDNRNIEWNELARYTYYKIKLLSDLEKIPEAMNIYNNNVDKLRSKPKILSARKIAQGLKNLNDFDSALDFYEQIEDKITNEYFIKYEMGMCYYHKSDHEKALEYLAKAILMNNNNMTKGSVIGDFAIILHQIGEHDLAQDQLSLYLEMRKYYHQPIAQRIKEILKEYQRRNNNYNDLMKKCSPIWQKYGQNNLALEKGLTGSIMGYSRDKYFCFIKRKNNPNVFCESKQLPKNISNGDRVSFDTVPSFDKKKKQKSVKAVNVKKLN